MNEKRIGVLDSYRFLAITLVILYHYYARWTMPLYTANLYPYGNKFSNTITTNATLGVEFFFIISGFVIYFSILRCHTFVEFLKKRFIRLFPPLLLCALITFVTVRLLDPAGLHGEFRNHIVDFLPSITFTDTILWNKILPRHNIHYIDGAYWSLVVEVKFYLLAGILYFLIRKKEYFVRAWSIMLVLILIVCELNNMPFLHAPVPFMRMWFLQTIFFYPYILFFSLGIYFYDYFINSKLRMDYIVPAFMILLYSYRHIHLWTEIVLLFVFMAFFLCLIFNNFIAKWLDRPLLKHIGMASYTIYLLHQNIGVLLISKCGGKIPSALLMDIFPLLVYLFFIAVSTLIYKYYELPSKRILSAFFFRKKHG